jgi:hypothetical protein
VAAEYFLRPMSPALRFEYLPQNVSTARSGQSEIGEARYA